MHISKRSSTFAPNLKNNINNNLKKIIMRHVFIINSLKENDTLVFKTEKRAKEWIEKWKADKSLHIAFQNSEQNDLYICRRVVF